MKLTDDQLAELRSRIFQKDPDAAAQIADHIAPLIEDFMRRATAVGWEVGYRREEWAIAFSHKDGRDLATGSESWVRYWTAPEHHDLVPQVVGVRSATNARAVRRTVRQSPWRTA